MKKILLLSIIFLSSCSLNKVIQHHGIHNLEQKHQKLKIEYSNKNDIIKLIGPPSTQSVFDSEVFIYIERKTSSSKLHKLGKKELIKNDVLILELNSKGILISKKFL
jgi:outer membrane protein assembly factor BamE (lipoprotein component of BamABCDE complex)